MKELVKDKQFPSPQQLVRTLCLGNNNFRHAGFVKTIRKNGEIIPPSPCSEVGKPRLELGILTTVLGVMGAIKLLPSFVQIFTAGRRIYEHLCQRLVFFSHVCNKKKRHE